MKILVCGSRDYNDLEQVKAILRDVASPGDVVIHGAARGADTCGQAAAAYLGLDAIAFPADWNRYGKSAGFKRNMQMLDERPGLVLAFFAGRRTPGTMHTVNGANQRGIPVKEYGLS